eukprot:TRINITY_DN37378_c0_g1_i1.p1 TRINITY_DN37378_c0_g1~~TRINITY_DN37378_c0_g1_i1.p1  ORF type:complete len:575 (+),score=128.48 TRINITY_DN37378_c0_g1_i1:66-1727(+)
MAPVDAGPLLSAAAAKCRTIGAKAEVVAVVDPYGSGRFLVDELLQRGWPVIAVRSSLTLPRHLMSTWNPTPFESIIVHHGDVAETAKKLKSGLPVRALAAGCEAGVALADELAAALDLSCNDPQLSRCRLDRGLQHERLRERGLRCCRHLRCDSPEEAVAALKNADEQSEAKDVAALASRPLVVKPCAPQGACDVLWVPERDPEALAAAVRRILDSKDSFGQPNKALVQEFLNGVEYIVDCVSNNSRHFISAIWVRKMRRGVVPERLEAVPFDGAKGSPQQLLHGYVFDCLDALGIRTGASTTKVMLDADTGPCLIDVGPYLHDGLGPALWSRCAGRRQAQATLFADLLAEDGHGELLQRLAAVDAGRPAYELQEFFMQLDLRCQCRGVLKESIEGTSGAWLRSLPTFHSLKCFVEDGDPVKPTRDLCSSPGYVVLMGSDREAAERDATALRERELSGQMYVLTGDARAPREEADAEEPAVRGQFVPLRTFACATRHYDLGPLCEKLLSPLVSRAASPVLSPVREPLLPPDLDDLVEFSLNCDGEDANLDDEP